METQLDIRQILGQDAFDVLADLLVILVVHGQSPKVHFLAPRDIVFRPREVLTAFLDLAQKPQKLRFNSFVEIVGKLDSPAVVFKLHDQKDVLDGRLELVRLNDIARASKDGGALVEPLEELVVLIQRLRDQPSEQIAHERGISLEKEQRVPFRTVHCG